FAAPCPPSRRTAGRSTAGTAGRSSSGLARSPAPERFLCAASLRAADPSVAPLQETDCLPSLPWAAIIALQPARRKTETQHVTQLAQPALKHRVYGVRFSWHAGFAASCPAALRDYCVAHSRSPTARASLSA